jgi:selenide,water dikinase
LLSRPAAVERTTSSLGPDRELVLVGGGHAHVQVLEGWAADPPPGVRLRVVVDRPVAVYSGMVPGVVAGQYPPGAIEIDVRPLAARAGAQVIVARALAVEPAERRLQLEGRKPIRYDSASFDVGSTVAGLELPGVREHALPTRPIASFVERVGEVVGRARERARFRLVVVGAGAGGVEVAFGFEARLRREGVRAASIALLESGDRVLDGYPAGVARRVERRARERGIEIRCGARVEAVEPERLRLAGGESLSCDAVAWVAGAASLPFFRSSGLPLDERGFVLVRSTLQVVGHDELFAAGDCASLVERPGLAKAGVYAVRQGPVLAENLRAHLRGQPLRAYRPQRDFLSLLNLGDGSAIGSKWGVSFEGRWTFRLKNWIDRRFVRRFQLRSPESGGTA